MSARTRSGSFDGVALALYDGLFAAAAEEMGVALMRTAHSPNIKERLDHSCAVFDARGRLVAQAAHIPVHLGSLPRAVEAALALGPFRPGDAVVLNDPYAGGTHLPDITLVTPVFLGRGRPDFFVASRAHHADVGGAAPGSMPLAREIHEEGLRIPPVFLQRAGRTQDDVLRLVLANVRTPDERRADLAAQLGAQATGTRRLAEYAKRRGRAELIRAAHALMDYSGRQVRAGLAKLPWGRWRFADALDDDGLGRGPVRIAVTLTLGRGRVRVDFTGSSAQVPGPVNAVEAVTRAACAYVLRCVLGGSFPVNDGAFRALQVIAPAGTVVAARPPAAVAAGNVETSQRIVDAVLGAFARALPGRIPAASCGTMNNVLIGGADPRGGGPFAYYETLGGGHGAGPGWHGASALQAHMTNTRNTPIEALEHAYPLRVVATRIRRGSGGRGRFRGGDGIVRALELLVPARVTVISERRARGPYGLAGGEPGRPGENRVQGYSISRTGERLPGKFQMDLPRGAVLTVASPGGGGFGRARRRR
ncbi:MAG: hydantoinase B/oxoprolinase family protein [Candidatus Eisenbacteria bacterium]|nr:hydantoinase B/oxoprolinase family protein [Candidatus Eisenbacteria bacterium]